jgi:hypothetical protein
VCLCSCMSGRGRAYTEVGRGGYDKRRNEPATIPPGPNPRHRRMVMTTVNVIHHAVITAMTSMSQGSGG